MERYFAADIGGTSVKCALVGADGTISHRSSFATGPFISAEQLVQGLCDAAMEAAGSGAAGIGISSLGWFNARTDECVGGVDNLPALEGLNLPALLGQRCGLPALVCNDVDAMAQGEYLFGAGRGCGSLVCIALGTGIGGAVMLEGRLWRGAHDRAGEFGYLGWRRDKSCLEHSTSALQMIDEAKMLLGQSELDGQAFFQRIRQGDSACAQVLHKHMKLLGEWTASLIIALDVERMIIGGGISASGDVLMPVLKEETEAYLPPCMHGQCELLAAQCGNDAALLGAVSGFFK